LIPPDDALAQSMAAFNHERFDGADLKAAAPVIASCQQVPMMAKKRLVELANPEDIAKGGARTARRRPRRSTRSATTSSRRARRRCW
jgi:DNA polymerase III delta subunit